MPKLKHPSKIQLQAWLDKELEAEGFLLISEHLQDCDQCCELVQRISAVDSLLEENVVEKTNVPEDLTANIFVKADLILAQKMEKKAQKTAIKNAREEIIERAQLQIKQKLLAMLHFAGDAISYKWQWQSACLSVLFLSVLLLKQATETKYQFTEASSVTQKSSVNHSYSYMDSEIKANVAVGMENPVALDTKAVLEDSESINNPLWLEAQQMDDNFYAQQMKDDEYEE